MVVIKKADLDSVYEHCRQEYPNEACGILSGRDGRVEKVYPMTNAEPSPSFYLMDSAEQFRVMKEMREAGTELVGIYHSHTGSPAYPSGTDVSLAYYPDAVHVIVSLMDRESPKAKAYIIVDEEISEVELNVLLEGK